MEKIKDLKEKVEENDKLKAQIAQQIEEIDKVRSENEQLKTDQADQNMRETQKSEMQIKSRDEMLTEKQEHIKFIK